MEQESIKKEAQGKKRTPAAPTAPRKQTKMMSALANALTKPLNMSPDLHNLVDQQPKTGEEQKRDELSNQQPILAQQDAPEVSEEPLQERP